MVDLDIAFDEVIASFSDEEFDRVVHFNTNVCHFPNTNTLNSSAKEINGTLSSEIQNRI